MTTVLIEQKERGIAMLIVMFALLLLSVVGMGMMYSTNMESAINSNYRDKQIATYASLAGLQEARDRIQPATHNIVAPTDLPSFVTTANQANAGVIYIVGNSSVDPTDPSNRYFDSEFCHTGVLGMTAPANGVPCSAGPTVPGGQTYYQAFVDHSLSASAPWNITTPLDMKWVRITLKGNNMTPIPTNGVPGTATQVCWDGHRQKLVPAGYGNTCGPNGSVAQVIITNPGTGYTSTPTVTFGAPPAGGTQATGTVNTVSVTNGQVTSVTLTAGGSGYTSVPAVWIYGGGGSGATAVATVNLAGSPVQSVNVSSAGTMCYSAPPTVSLTGGGGTGAAATAVLETNTSCVASWNPTANCGNPWKGNTETGVTVSGVAGSGFSGTITFHSSGHSITSSSIQNPGNGYTSAPTTSSGGSPNPLNASCIVTPNAIVGKRVQSVTVTSGGSGYTTAPTVTFSTGTGTTATLPAATSTLGPPTSGGDVLSVAVMSHGSNYTSAPTVGFSPIGPGSGASAIANLGTTTTVTGVTMTERGSGYKVPPTVTFSAPPSGTTATGKAVLGRGMWLGKVYMLTSLAETNSGARTMSQMEVASPVIGFGANAALTLDGPEPILGAMPNSNNFIIDGADNNSCGENQDPLHPAIAGYDDPNADPETHSVVGIISTLPRPDHYTGYGGTPSVVNGYDSLGETMGTTWGMKSVIDAIHAHPGANIYGNNPSSINLGTVTNPVVNYVDGDLTLNGNPSGYGILVVTGTLTMSGDFTWYGMVLVVGDGVLDVSGGGNGTIIGSVFVAKIWDSYTTKNLLTTLGSPSAAWNGGGNNGVRYDHCWSENLMNQIDYTPPPSPKPLKILSTKTLPY